MKKILLLLALYNTILAMNNNQIEQAYTKIIEEQEEFLATCNRYLSTQELSQEEKNNAIEVYKKAEKEMLAIQQLLEEVKKRTQ